MREEHVGAGNGSAFEHVLGAFERHHRRDRAELFTALDDVEPLEIFGPPGMREEAAMSEGAWSELAATLEPADDAVRREDRSRSMRDVGRTFECDRSVAQRVFDLVVCPTSAQRG